MKSEIMTLLNSFLEDSSDTRPKLIVIYGPTGCWKTALSLEIANTIQSEIISVDARQIYRWLNIGTGKITPAEMWDIKHHMIDIISPEEEYSAGDFRMDARDIIEEMHANGKIPVLCGGTGLYIDTLIYDFSLPWAPPDMRLRDELETFRLQNGNEALWKKLHDIDPEYANMLHINNYRYVMRGIEVMIQTGISKLHTKDERISPYNILFITPFDGNRDALYEKINHRIDQMFTDGLIEEVEHLLKNTSKDVPGLNTIGYREVIDYLDGNISLERCKELVKQHNRNYAKRQLTWNKRYQKQ